MVRMVSAVRKEMVNGVVVPYDRPIEVLQEMMLTDNMGEFAAVC